MWNADTFAHHNRSLGPAQAAHAAAIANHVLKSTRNEGEAIATANRFYMRPHRDGGGMVPASPSVAPTGGLQPSVTTENPLYQNYLQRFSSMSPEQLQELLPRLGGSPLGQIAQSVLQQKRVMPQQANPQPQPSMGVPAAPQGATAPQSALPPQASPPPQAVPQQARGGMTAKRREGRVPILAAGGEFIIAPHYVRMLGGGDPKEGHRRLDAQVVEWRKKIVDTTRKLKPPVKS